METMETNTASTGSLTTNKQHWKYYEARPQFLPVSGAWKGKAYIEGYVERIRSIRDAFQNQTSGPIVRPDDFKAGDTQYFWELQMLYGYGGFTWPTVFLSIKPKR